jgi:hypothetical protein
MLQFRGDSSYSKFQTLKFGYVGDYNRNENSSLQQQQFTTLNGVGFFLSNFHSNHLQMTKCYLLSKEGWYTYSNYLTHLETIILWFLGSFCNWSSSSTTAHLPHGFMSIVTNGLDRLVKIAFARNRWNLVTRTLVVATFIHLTRVQGH